MKVLAGNPAGVFRRFQAFSGVFRGFQAFSGVLSASILAVTCPAAWPPRRGQSCRPGQGSRVSEDRVFGVGAGVAPHSRAHFPLPRSSWATSDAQFVAILGIPIASGLETCSFPKKGLCQETVSAVRAPTASSAHASPGGAHIVPIVMAAGTASRVRGTAMTARG